MKNNKWGPLFILLLAFVLLTAGCTDTTAADSQATTLEEATCAEGYEVIGGSWEADALYYRNKWVPLAENDALADMYDSTFLFINEDGTYTYTNLFFHEGTYSKKGDNTFLLKDTRCYRLTTENGETKEVDSTNDSLSRYLITVLDNNSFRFAEMDPMTGAEKTDLTPLRFSKQGKTDSGYTPGSDKAVITTSTPSTATTKGYSDSDKYATSGEKNALAEAKSYLRSSAFSHEGLIEQLEYEGYSYSEAKYGADNCGADWNEQALLSAKSYLRSSAFSYSGLIEQLEYEGFTSSQAKYGVDNCGADWYEQAVKCAKSYLRSMSFSRSELIDQLEYEGFSYDQAVHGVDQAY
ncbi:MAG: Ltp family lipoprotein [Clostridia bacterium]|nr:Ltp family lipoprotein [Clostridia bacterium]